MLQMKSMDFFEVGKAPDQVRKNLEIGNTTSSLRRLKELRDGIEQDGDAYFDSIGSKRLFRDIAKFSHKGYDPGIITGNSSSKYNRVRDFSDMYRFMAVLEQDNESLRSSSRLEIHVSGYTDRAQLDSDGIPDPETLLHINSITVLRVVNNGGIRGEDEYQVVDNSMVVLPNRLDRGTEKFSSPYALPSYADAVEDDDSVDIEDELIVDGDGFRARSIRHNVSSPDKYFTVLARSDLAGADDRRKTMGGAGGAGLWDTQNLSLGSFTQNYIANGSIDRPVRENTFYQAFVDASGEFTDEVGHGLYHDNAFVFEDLMEACGVRSRDYDRYVQVRHFENTDYDAESWRGAHDEARGAYDICHRIPELMLDNLIMGCAFTVSNREGGLRGRVTTEFSFLHDVNDRGGDSYNITPITGSGRLPGHFLESFERKIIDEVFQPLADYGEVQLSITVFSTLAGLTRVEIGYGNDHEEPYIFTSFCESRLNNSLIRQGDGEFRDLVGGYSALRGEVGVGSMTRASKKYDREWQDDLGAESRGNSERPGRFLGFDSKREEPRRSGGLGLGLGGRGRDRD